ADDGRGFLVKAEDVIAETRKGKQVVTPRAGAHLKLVRPIGAEDDAVAAVATIASCSSSRSPKSPSWRAGRGCSCSATATGALPMRGRSG
ncbi:hypothetical protein, partial [Escherichia coli]|uniref:hypothetical protein n=1 Tax=Escherichia coli TaxID=562 RepID=UPI001954E151